jgi:DNA-binding protein YbaB
VSAVAVAVDWRERLRGGGTLEAAAGQAVQAATRARLETWARVFSDPESATTGGPPVEVPADYSARLREAATGEVTAETGAAVLSELLELLQQVEQGLDEVSERLSATVNRSLTGRSPNDQVRVTVSGGGEVREVRLERRWLRHAHATDIGRQLLAALGDAYAKVDREGVTQLVAGSALGEAQRAVQDPFGLARRMRLTE